VKVDLRPQSRRRFLSSGAAGLAGLTIGLSDLRANSTQSLTAPAAVESGESMDQRSKKSLEIRQDAALRNSRLPQPSHKSNGDEDEYQNRIGNYSKGLPHDQVGIVRDYAYASLLHALHTCRSADFDSIPLGGSVPLVNPQSGLTFDLVGIDSHRFGMKPAPTVDSAERASEAVECYWIALLRDVGFASYGSNPLAIQACTELSNLADFRGLKNRGLVTPTTLFRGDLPGDGIGPYVSQFLLQPMAYGALPLVQKINTILAPREGGADYLTNVSSWLTAQNGQGPFEKNRVDPILRHIRNGRDLSAYVHSDLPYEAFFNACLWLNDHKVPANSGNPYRGSANQAPFASFGIPHLTGLLGLVSMCALRAVWYQKWFVHRTLRPEEYGGRVHFTLSGRHSYPIHEDVLKSTAVAKVFSQQGSYLLPNAYPEGCPQHPSYAQGHSAIAGACVTLLKAFFDTSGPMNKFGDLVRAADDGVSLMPYKGFDAGDVTVEGELNKLASNIGTARNHAGIHWRSDCQQGLLLGEAVTLGVIKDSRYTFNEGFEGLKFKKFDGTEAVV
jgi:hypothetical protein